MEAYLSDHQIAGSQFVAAQLRLGDVDILVADPVVRRTQETDAFAHDLQNSAAQLNAFLLRFRLTDHHSKRLFFQAIGIRNIQPLCQVAQFGKRFVLKFKYFHSLFSLGGMLEKMKCKIAQNASSNLVNSLRLWRGMDFRSRSVYA